MARRHGRMGASRMERVTGHVGGTAVVSVTPVDPTAVAFRRLDVGWELTLGHRISRTQLVPIRSTPSRSPVPATNPPAPSPMPSQLNTSPNQTPIDRAASRHPALFPVPPGPNTLPKPLIRPTTRIGASSFSSSVEALSLPCYPWRLRMRPELCFLLPAKRPRSTPGKKQILALQQLLLVPSEWRGIIGCLIPRLVSRPGG